MEHARRSLHPSSRLSNGLDADEETHLRRRRRRHSSRGKRKPGRWLGALLNFLKYFAMFLGAGACMAAILFVLWLISNL